MDQETRIEYVRIVWDTFCQVHKIKREISNAEWHLARKWAMTGVPVATVLQGIHETTGKIRRLEACDRAVQENVGRHGQAVPTYDPPL